MGGTGAAARTTTGVVVATLGTLHPQGVATKLFAVELLNHGISDFLVVDVGETETAAAACFAIPTQL